MRAACERLDCLAGASCHAGSDQLPVFLGNTAGSGRCRRATANSAFPAPLIRTVICPYVPDVPCELSGRSHNWGMRKYYMENTRKRWTAISLFAGAGGCALGFMRAGVEILAAFDVNPSAVATYNLNFQGDRAHCADLSVYDVKRLLSATGISVEGIDIVLGGPPCQGFTTAGQREADDPRNALVNNYVRALGAIRPRWFMFENVEGILTTQGGTSLIDALQSLMNIGYSLALKKVYMQEYSVPQRRKRVIVVGNRLGIDFEFPKPDALSTGPIFRHGPSTLRDAIEDLEGLESRLPDHDVSHLSSTNLTRIRLLEPGQSMKDLPASLQHDSFKRRSSRRVCDGTPSEKRGGAPSGLRRLVYDEPSLTITSMANSEFVHPKLDRYLTIRECARIQTFPDEFRFAGSPRQKMRQIGNAIPPLFAEQIAKQIQLYDRMPQGKIGPVLGQYEVTRATAMSPALEKTCRMLDGLSGARQLKWE